MILDTWAKRWNVPDAALEELRAAMGVYDVKQDTTGMSEAAVTSRVKLEASQKNCRLWRNNVGACMDSEGNFIRYGLANESKKLNQNFKSSDLVGIRPVLIQPHHVGNILGQFLAREIKKTGWKYRPNDKRMAAQFNFIQLIQSMGGDAAFATGEGTI